MSKKDPILAFQIIFFLDYELKTKYKDLVYVGTFALLH